MISVFNIVIKKGEISPLSSFLIFLPSSLFFSVFSINFDAKKIKISLFLRCCRSWLVSKTQTLLRFSFLREQIIETFARMGSPYLPFVQTKSKIFAQTPPFWTLFARRKGLNRRAAQKPRVFLIRAAETLGLSFFIKQKNPRFWS